jgi:hypothetical protein
MAKKIVVPHRLRHKHTVSPSDDCRYRKHGDKPYKLKKTQSTSFDMDIDLPVGGADPDPTGLLAGVPITMTVTGPITNSTATPGVTVQVWYTNSSGTNTPLDATTIVYTPTPCPPAPMAYQWSITFTAPPPDNYTFFIDGTFAPPRAPGSTSILISAPFTTATVPAPGHGQRSQ